MAKIINQKIGAENYIKIFYGYYKKPREVNRIFMFIDLISSTHYAEVLGHEKYSRFIQECFKNIGLLEMEYNAKQYQFVGDEVVLTWSADKKQNYKNAVDFFFDFTQKLRSREKFFISEFGIVPKFTASLNSGKVMMAEVGDIKSELAFHGDVLNTAARMQKQCKKFNADLLATHDFISGLVANTDTFITTHLGMIRLRGKKEEADIWSVSK